jgi:hypothetical protein
MKSWPCRQGSRALVLLATALLLSACVGRLVNTITADQAAALVEQHLRDFAAALPGARLEEFGGASIADCDQPNDGGPLGRVFAENGYWVRDIPQERNPATFDLAVRYWTDHGFRVLTDKRPAVGKFVSVEGPAPDFTGMSLQESSDGHGILSVSASSDCVWPHGTPAPKTRP